MTLPRFSVIVPVYNAQKYLRECLDSILAQDFAGWEAICIDDGSTDNSAAILDEYAARDGRFRVVHQPNGGEGVARNAGLALAGGEIITWVDADDFLDEGVLVEVNDAFLQHEPDMVRVRYKRFCGEQCEKVGKQRHGVELIVGRNPVREWSLRTLTVEGFCCMTFVKRAKFRHEFPVGVQYAGDSLFMLANATEFDKVVQSEYVGYYYRDTPTSIMKKPFPSAERVRFFRAFLNVVDLYGGYDRKFSWMGWFHLVNWCLRPKDTIEKREIRRLFCKLTKTASVRRKDVSLYAQPAFALYVSLGWRWPTVCTYRVIMALVRIRQILRRYS